MRSRREFVGLLAATATVLFAGGGRALAIWGAEESGFRPAARAFAWRTLPIRHLTRLRRDFERIRDGGHVSDNEVFRGYIGGFTFNPVDSLPGARSIIVVAVPDHITRIDFQRPGETLEVLIPPGYAVTGPGLDELKERLRREVLKDPGAALEHVKLPLKLLAARTGLGSYGRNNICYVRGLGSYHALRAFYTDRDFGVDTWQEVRMMRRCRGCDVCIKACPTGCIARDRFVIDVGKCIPLFNERPEPIPEWLDERVHNAFVGCLKCQYTCPANTEYPGAAERLAVVPEGETRKLLEGDLDDALKESLERRLARFGLVADLAHLSRNLRLVVRAAASGGGVA